MIEPLESRILLSVAVVDHVLQITGEQIQDAAVGDVVTVWLTHHVYHISQNGVVTHFRSSRISSIFADLGGGNDRFNAILAQVPVTALGRGGRDKLLGGTKDDQLIGGDGFDILSGGDGNDSLWGNAGDDYLHGGSGALISNDGNDQFSGGPGSDYADYNGRTDDLRVDLTQPDKNGAVGELDRIMPDVENVLGGSGNDLLIGNDQDNFLSGGAGNDTLLGGAGNDDLIAAFTSHPEVDVVAGEAGFDYFFTEDHQPDLLLDANPGEDFFRFDLDPRTGAFLDYQLPVPGPGAAAPASMAASRPIVPSALTLQPLAARPTPPGGVVFASKTLTVTGQTLSDGNGTDDTIDIAQTGRSITVTLNGNRFVYSKARIKQVVVNAGSGDDRVTIDDTLDPHPAAVRYYINGGDGNDTITSGRGADSLSGGAGNDSIAAAGGNDTLRGGAGDDILSGANGQDLLDGGEQGLASADGRDVLSGGAGEDVASYLARSDSLRLSLNGQADDGADGEGDSLGSDIEDIFSGSGNDTIQGSASVNFIFGGDGADDIRGGGGNDPLYPAGGADDVWGDAGVNFIFAVDGQKDQLRPGSDESSYVRQDAIDVIMP